MRDKKTMKRVKAFERLLKEQSREKLGQKEEPYDSDLVADSLMELSELLSDAADLSMEIAEMVREKAVDSGCFFIPCCMMEDYYDDEF